MTGQEAYPKIVGEVRGLARGSWYLRIDAIDVSTGLETYTYGPGCGHRTHSTITLHLGSAGPEILVGLRDAISDAILQHQEAHQQEITP